MVDAETQRLAQTLGAAAVKRATSGHDAAVPKKMPMKKPAAAPDSLPAPLPVGLVKRVGELSVDDPPSDPGAASSGTLAAPPAKRPLPRPLPPQEKGDAKQTSAHPLACMGRAMFAARKLALPTRIRLRSAGQRSCSRSRSTDR